MKIKDIINELINLQEKISAKQYSKWGDLRLSIEAKAEIGRGIGKLKKLSGE